MDYLGIVLKQLHFLAEQVWLRDVALLVAIVFIAYLPGRISSRALRPYRDSPEVARSPVLRVLLELLDASFWPLWAILLLSLGFKVWVHLAPQTAGDPFQVLPILWFFFLYRLLTELTKDLLPPGTRRKRIRRGVIPLVFILAALQQLDLLRPLTQGLEHPIFHVGTVDVSTLSILIALLIWAVFILIARLVDRILRFRFFPGLGMDSNIGDSLATLFRYGVVLVGILAAVESLGFDLTTLKIGLGALGLGIGFGLQNVVNNIVSGFIILFERTIKKGDMIVVEGTDGRVVSIGLRSSVVRTRSGHEIIVPNSELVTHPVTNFSFRDRLVRVGIQVGVSYSADPHQIRDLLLQAAHEEEKVLPQPPPDVLFMGYGESSINFELRVWVDDPWEMPQVRSALYFSIWYKLKNANIEVPFPQRDLHIRDEELKVRIRSPLRCTPPEDPPGGEPTPSSTAPGLKETPG